MSDTNHNLEVAKECKAYINLFAKTGIEITFNEAGLSSYTSRICAEKAIAIEAIDAELLSQQAARISELERVVARQADALKFVKSELYAGMVPIMQKKVDAAISDSAESVAAWEAKKLEPLQDHIYELQMELDCAKNRVCCEIADLTKAKAEAEQRIKEST